MDTKLLDSAEARSYLGVGRSNFFRLLKDPAFPKPVQLYAGQRKKLWTLEQLRQFVAAKATLE